MTQGSIPGIGAVDPPTRKALLELKRLVDAAAAAGGGGGVTDHGALTGLADDDHPQYLNNARGDARYEALGAVAAHAGAADPHTGYQKESERAAANGYASLDAGTKVPIAQIPTGTSGTTVPFGNDARFSDTRTPTDNTVSTIKVVDNAVTNAKLADVATATIKGRNTAGTGDPEDLSTATVAGMLAVGGDLSGTVSNAQIVASAVGTTELAADAVTNAKLANVATATIKGRVTAATGDPEDLTGTQATTLLDVFTSTLKGLAPASGGGTTTFLRADGTWAAPPGGGGGGSLTVQEDDVTVDAAATTLDFGNGFDVTSSPAGEANVALDLGEYTGTDLPVASGGTGASDAATARTNLGINSPITKASTASQLLGTADTYVTNSNLPLVGRQQAGTFCRWRLYVDKTAAGTATPIITVRLGTLGTTGDASVGALTFAAQTAATDKAVIEIELVFRTIGAPGTTVVSASMWHHNTTTGVANKAQEQFFATAQSPTTSGASLIAGVSVNAGASSAWTVQYVTAEAHNLT